jgi:hypothetical protein
LLLALLLALPAWLGGCVGVWPGDDDDDDAADDDDATDDDDAVDDDDSADDDDAADDDDSAAGPGRFFGATTGEFLVSEGDGAPESIACTGAIDLQFHGDVFTGSQACSAESSLSCTVSGAFDLGVTTAKMVCGAIDFDAESTLAFDGPDALTVSIRAAGAGQQFEVQVAWEGTAWRD